MSGIVGTRYYRSKFLPAECRIVLQSAGWPLVSKRLHYLLVLSLEKYTTMLTFSVSRPRLMYTCGLLVFLTAYKFMNPSSISSSGQAGIHYRTACQPRSTMESSTEFGGRHRGHSAAILSTNHIVRRFMVITIDTVSNVNYSKAGLDFSFSTDS